MYAIYFIYYRYIYISYIYILYLIRYIYILSIIYSFSFCMGCGATFILNFHFGILGWCLTLGCQACSYCCVACLCGLIRWDDFFAHIRVLVNDTQTPEFHELWDTWVFSLETWIQFEIAKVKPESVATSYSPYVALRIVTFRTWASLQHVTSIVNA